MSDRPPPHPSPFADEVLSAIELEHAYHGWLRPEDWVLDPFAGIGRVHSLGRLGVHTVGVEIEPEWARAHPATFVGDALDLPFDEGAFDAVVTSPVYGNRMSDHHDARDGSRRITYRHKLNRPVSERSSGKLQWGRRYRQFHIEAWTEVTRVVGAHGVFMLNISDHVRDWTVQPVADWHVQALDQLGWTLRRDVQVPTPRLRFGANHDARVDHERLIVFTRGCDQ